MKLRFPPLVYRAAPTSVCLATVLLLSVSATAAQSHDPAAPVPATQEHGGQAAHSAEIDDRPKIAIRGFSNVDFSQTGNRDEPGGFTLGQFVLHMSSSLGKKVSFFGETSFSARPAGFTTEVERLILRYDVNDRLKISIGRYHTPINYWNTAFHHGFWLQSTIGRPEMIQGGGTFQPVHFVGLLAEGTLSSAALGLGYNVGVGNGRGTAIARGGDAGDANRKRAWVAKLFARPGSFSALEFGGALYRDQVPSAAASVTDMRESITSGYVAFTRESPELIAEIARVAHHDAFTNQDYISHAFYVQTAYRLTAHPSWKPYFRFEKLLTATAEPVLDPQDLRLTTMGVRYELTGYAALKGEYRNTRRIDGGSNGLYLQAAWTF